LGAILGALLFTISFKYKAYESFARNMLLFDEHSISTEELVVLSSVYPVPHSSIHLAPYGELRAGSIDVTRIATRIVDPRVLDPSSES
jgi:hypothetical protein